MSTRTIAFPIPLANPSGAVVGEIRPSEWGPTLYKTVDPVRHQLRRPPAWALAGSHIEQLRRADGSLIVLESADGRRWAATLAQFDRHGFAFERGDHEPQVALPMKWWDETRTGARQASLWEATA
jgi:hypothetical protein